MSNDLISRSELLKELQTAMDDSVRKYGKVAKKTPILKTTKLIIELIENMPTAYDTDKVVQELEEISENYVEYNPPLNDYESGFESGVEVGIDKAIEIVRNGGVL